MFISEVLNKYIKELEDRRQQLVEKHKKFLPWYLSIPIVAGLVAFLTIGIFQSFFVGLAMGGLISGLVYGINISGPFQKIKTKLKIAILEDLMNTFHSDVDFSYTEYEQDVEKIAKGSNLFSANRFNEEDVIKGKYGNVDFYISEIHLSRKRKKSRVTVFDGLLFKIRLPDKFFPSARIQSKPKLISKMFGGYELNEEFGFYYDTENRAHLEESLGSLFPFFRHLIETNDDLRISVEGNEIVMFLNSDMKFLDDPEPRLKESLLSSRYVENIAQQINSLLFIVETLSSNLNDKEIEDRLELKVLEYMEDLEDEENNF